ncbi:MAG TPA: polysaccharide biosynthesis C-terminal domain-containing protein [Nitrososphaera sp.]|nr:polysaccharide biosynthesis C-terminal domain-containing protein [Nitrososphaera sp.]
MKLLKRLPSALILNSGVALIDQAILSATNLVIAFILIKTVPKEEYGHYSIVFAVSLFLISIQNAIVTTPLAVLLAAKDTHRKNGYVAALFWGQLLAIIPAAVLGLIATGGLYLYGLDAVEVWTIGALCVGAIGILLREFSRAYYFAQESPLKVLKLDTLYTLIYFGLTLMAFGLFRISVPLIFLFMGASGLITSLLFNCRGSSFSWQSIRDSYREHWAFGKWALLGILVTHVQSYCNLYLIGSLLSTAAAGSVSASRLPLAPLQLLQIGWGKIAIPRGSRLREAHQLRRFIKEQAVVTIGIAAAITAYVAVLLMSSDLLKRFLFNKGYESSLDFIVFWGAINIASFAWINASCGLQVMKEFGIIAKINAVTMVVTLAATYVLIGQYGIKGGLASSLLGETLLALALWWCLLRRYLLYAHAPQTRPKLLRWTLLYSRKGVSL